MSQHLLIAYDGSEDAGHAIRVAGGLFPGAAAEVAHAWEPLTSVAARSAIYAMVAAADTDAILAQETASAEAVAQEGAEIARAAGLDATAVALGGSAPAAATLVQRIETTGPRLVVIGTRGLTGMRSTLVGSVSHTVASHAKVPVLVVPRDAPVEDRTEVAA